MFLDQLNRSAQMAQKYIIFEILIKRANENAEWTLHTHFQPIPFPMGLYFSLHTLFDQILLKNLQINLWFYIILLINFTEIPLILP